MKNEITIDQFRKLEKLADDYNNEHEQWHGEVSVLAMLTTEDGDGPEREESAVMVTLEAYDWDGNTDFGTIAEMLDKVGVELDENELLDGYQVCRLQNAGEWTPQAYSTTGDADYGSGRTCRTFAYCLILAK